MKLQEESLDWALKHLLRYAHSDFFPKIFEVQAIQHNWNEVKKHILSLNIESYSPKTPTQFLVPKPNGNFRVVHQLDPIDSVIYTALIKEICEIVELYRIPAADKVACSYRIKPDLEGSFFSTETGWDDFTSNTTNFINKYKDGYVIVADITDFYNQIYLHRINNLLEEANSNYVTHAYAIEKFLMGLNNNASKGIPVGPAPSIVLSELIMADIDRFIQCDHTKDFVRYADDMRIFFQNYSDAQWALHELTEYLHTNHRLVLSGEKTKILKVSDFDKLYNLDENKLEKNEIIKKANAITRGKMQQIIDSFPPYTDNFDYDAVYKTTIFQVLTNDQFAILCSTYDTLFEKAYLSTPVDYALLRHILKQATKYRIRCIAPKVIKRFSDLLPVLREVIIYLRCILDEQTMLTYQAEFKHIFSSDYMKIPFINWWVCYLLQIECFKKFNESKGLLHKNACIRSQALVAINENNPVWVRSMRSKLNDSGSWDKRGILYSSKLLPRSERNNWLRTMNNNGDILDKSIISMVNGTSSLKLP